MDTTTNGNGNALAVTKPAATSITLETNPYEPRSVGDAFKMAQAMVESKFLPKSVQTAQQALAIMATGKEYGFSMMQSFRLIHIIEGKPSLSADAQLALVLSSGKAEYFMAEETSAKVAKYVTKRRGAPVEQRLSFTIDEAKDAGLTGKDNWKKYPSAMLRARCIAALARMVYPDVVGGTYDPDEIQPDDAPPPAPPSAAAKKAPAPAVLSPDLATLVCGWEEQLLQANTLDEIKAVNDAVVAVVEKNETLKRSAELSALRKLKEERIASVQVVIVGTSK
jgi:hypothetical protein